MVWEQYGYGLGTMLINDIHTKMIMKPVLSHVHMGWLQPIVNMPVIGVDNLQISWQGIKPQDTIPMSIYCLSQ